MARMRRATLRLLLLALPLLAACVTPGYRGNWQPKPSEGIVTGENGTPEARLSTSVLGLWRGDPWNGELHVRFLIVSLGNTPLSVPVERIELLTGDLQSCVAPHVVGGEAREVPPGGTVSFDVSFTPPLDSADLSGLLLRWVVLMNGHELPGSVSFQYVGPLYAYIYPAYGYAGWGYGWGPGCYPGWCWGGGFGGPAVVQTLPPTTTSIPNR
jgi:hypothetical protein